MGMLWKVTINPDESVVFTTDDAPGTSVRVEFPGGDVRQSLQFNGQRAEMQIYGTLKLRSLGNGGNSYDIPTGSGGD